VFAEHGPIRTTAANRDLLRLGEQPASARNSYSEVAQATESRSNE
jgi:hypothetical protein